MPVCSLRDPTRYQTLKLTTGALRTSLTSTVRPFGNTVSCTPAVRADAWDGAGAVAAPGGTPTAARRAPRGTPAGRRGGGRRGPERGGGGGGAGGPEEGPRGARVK